MLAVIKALVYAVVVFGLLYFAYKKRDSKTLFHVIMVLCWIVIAMSMDSRDIYNYRRAYDGGILRGKEPLFDLLQWTFYSLGVPFAVFKLLYSTTIWFLLYKGLKNYTVELALAAAIFVLGPMMGYGTQMRSSMAGAILLNAIPLLMKKDEKVWKYCALVAFASLFHLMAVFYFIFLIPKYWKTSARKFRNYMYILAVLLIPFLLLVRIPIYKLLILLQTWTNIGVLGRLARYFSGEMGPNIKGFLFTSCAHFVGFLATDRMCSAMQSVRKKATRQQREAMLLNSYAVGYLRKLNSLLLLIIPCYVLCLQFDRFNSYYLPVGYCLIAQGARELRESGAVQKFELPTVKLQWFNRVFQWVDRNDFLQTGNFEILVLLACMIFCFFVSNRFSATSEFVRIINGIGMFVGPK